MSGTITENVKDINCLPEEYKTMKTKGLSNVNPGYSREFAINIIKLLLLIILFYAQSIIVDEYVHRESSGTLNSMTISQTVESRDLRIAKVHNTVLGKTAQAETDAGYIMTYYINDGFQTIH